MIKRNLDVRFEVFRKLTYNTLHHPSSMVPKLAFGLVLGRESMSCFFMYIKFSVLSKWFIVVEKINLALYL